LLEHSVTNTDEELWVVGESRSTVDGAVDAIPVQHHSAAVYRLIRLLNNSGDSYVRVRTLRALERLGPDATDAVPALTAIVRNDSDIYAQLYAIDALKQIGVSSREVIDSLTNALQSDAAGIRTAAALALSRLNAESAVPALLAALDRDEIYQNRRAFVIALGEFGAAAQLAGNKLTSIIEDEDEFLLFRRDAFEALQRIDAKAAANLSDKGGAVAWMREYPSDRESN
jgi:HEAT repeat protein